MDVPSRMESGDRGQEDIDEAHRGFFGMLGSRIGKQRGDAAANLHTHDALLLLRNYEESGQGWFWSTDAKGRLTYITDSVARLMGRTTGELLGTAFTDNKPSVEFDPVLAPKGQAPYARSNRLTAPW